MTVYKFGFSEKVRQRKCFRNDFGSYNVHRQVYKHIRCCFDEILEMSFIVYNNFIMFLIIFFFFDVVQTSHSPIFYYVNVLLPIFLIKQLIHFERLVTTKLDVVTLI